MTSVKSTFKPALFSLIFAVLIASAIYWLWQRQPQPAKENHENKSIQENTQEKITEKVFEINPADGSVLKDKSVSFEGKSQANSYIVISSNNTIGITQADDNGNFEIQTELTEGLNLINIITIDDNLAEQHIVSQTLYVQADLEATRVIAGPVKSIFDEIITVTTAQGEQTIRKKTSTKLLLGENEDDKEDSEIRVGDYLISLGTNESEKEFNAEQIQIIRQEKPQNIEKYVAGILASNVKENIFSIKNIKDSSIVEFTINKDSTISKIGEEADAKDILKDKQAIIIYYTEEGENIPDLIYMLP